MIKNKIVVISLFLISCISARHSVAENISLSEDSLKKNFSSGIKLFDATGSTPSITANDIIKTKDGWIRETKIPFTFNLLSIQNGQATLDTALGISFGAYFMHGQCTYLNDKKQIFDTDFFMGPSVDLGLANDASGTYSLAGISGTLGIDQIGAKAGYDFVKQRAYFAVTTNIISFSISDKQQLGDALHW